MGEENNNNDNKENSFRYSCLMSVYKEEKPSFLDLSLQSMESQTVPPSEYILMLDGPIGNELQAIIDHHQQKMGHILHTIQLERNLGLHGSLRIGVEQCSYEWIARMDTDDYSDPHRIEHQKNFLTNHPNYDVIGTLCTEFIESPSHPICLVQLPETDTEIRKFAKLRNPCRHPSILFRKSAVLEAGNYQNYPYFEDYDLFVRMLMRGSKFYNIQEPLVSMRVNEDFYSRRGGWPYTKDMVGFRWHLHKLGFLSTSQALKGIILHSIVCLVPNGLREWAYKKLLRKRINTNH